MFVASAFVLLQVRHQQGVARTAEAFESYRPQRMGEFGETQHLRVTPLVDYHTSRDDVVGEVGAELSLADVSF